MPAASLVVSVVGSAGDRASGAAHGVLHRATGGGDCAVAAGGRDQKPRNHQGSHSDRRLPHTADGVAAAGGAAGRHAVLASLRLIYLPRRRAPVPPRRGSGARGARGGDRHHGPPTGEPLRSSPSTNHLISQYLGACRPPSYLTANVAAGARVRGVRI